jgi:hypothetical protein
LQLTKKVFGLIGKKRKAQVSLEYAMVAIVVGLTVLPAAYMFYKYSWSTADQIDKTQLDRMGRDIASTAEKIYYQGAPSRTEYEARLPKGILNITLMGEWGKQNQEIDFMATAAESPTTDYSYPIKVNVNGSFNGTFYELSTGAGVKKINVEAYELNEAGGSVTSFVYINFGGRCPRSNIYDLDGSGGAPAAADLTFLNNCMSGLSHSRPTKTWAKGWFEGTTCVNADYTGDCTIDTADRCAFCTKNPAVCAPC